MGVFKRFNGKRLKSSKDKNWSRGTWYVWKRIRGRVIHKALPEAVTKDDAEAAEREIVARAFSRRYGVIDDTLFADFATNVYLNYVRQKNVNIVAKEHYVDVLIEYLGKTPLMDITPQTLRDVQWKLQRRRLEPRDKDKKTRPEEMLSKSSVNRIMSTASKIFTLACEEGKLEINPMRHVKMLREPPPRSRLLTAEEKEKLWAELAKDVLMSRLVILATNLPLRRAQLVAITTADVDLANGALFVTASKGRSRRFVPLNGTSANILSAMITDGQLPFPLKDFRKRWSRITQAAGINTKGGRRGENFTFHDLRKEFASELLRRNVNPELINQLFAHSTMQITQAYMHGQLTDLTTAVQTLDPTVQESEVVQ